MAVTHLQIHGGQTTEAIDMLNIPKTIIIDIDGCIFKHCGKGACHQWLESPAELLPHVKEAFNCWEKDGCYIILMTARKESCRPILEHTLRNKGLFWDLLIMSVPHGERIIINDRKSNGDASCTAINLERNAGL